MVHSPELFIASAILYLCRRETEESSGLRKFTICILLALGILVRAFSILAFLSPVLVYSALHRLKTRSFALPVSIFAGTFFGIALLAGYQWMTSGSPWVPGYLIEFPELTQLFAAKPEGLEIISNNVQGMSKWLTGWHTGSFFFILAFLLFHRQLKTWDRLLLLSSGMLVLLYSCYLIQDQLFGPRMFFLVAPVLLLFISRLALPSDVKISGFTMIILPAIILSVLASWPERIPSLIKKWTPTNYQSGNFKVQLDRLPEQRSIVFLQKSISQEFVNWNEPFLQSNVIICRDFEQTNTDVSKLFPGYRKMFFRQNENFEISKPQDPFIISETADYGSPGQISFFNVALAVEAAGKYPSQDFFDICYKDVLTLDEARSQLNYVSNLHFDEDRIYKQAFRTGMVHVIRLLLLPAAAFAEKGNDWSRDFNLNEFRHEYEQAITNLSSAGEIGKNLCVQIRKVGKRIDSDMDGRFSDEELRRFLSQKVKNL